MPENKSLRSQFEKADGARAPSMRRARDCAMLTHPDMLPESGTTDGNTLARSYQSLGADGLSNLVSKIVLTVFPPNMPIFRYKPSAKLRSDPAATPEFLDRFQQFFYARELLIHSQLDATKFRTKFRIAFEHTLGVGNSLTLCGGEDGDYWFKNFRMDHFVQKRGGDGEILWIITHEKKDPLELSDEDLQAAGLVRADLEQKDSPDRLQNLYTKCSRIRGAKGWKIEQELNDKIIRTSEEPVSPYLSLGYIELAGEDYSRGFVEERMADLKSFNTLCKAILDWSVAVSKYSPVLDPSTSGEMTPRDLAKDPGEVLVGRVVDGKVQGVGVLTTDMAKDLNVVLALAGAIERRVGKQFLLETEAQRQAERVTATEVMRVARQLEGALGAIYAEIASEIQRALHDRLLYQMERDKLIVPLPEQFKAAVDIEVLTGLEALGRQVELERVVGALQLIATMPELMARISPERLMALIFQGYNIDMAQLVKTAEEMQAEAEARMAEQVQTAAGEQAVKTAGAVIQEGAKQQAAMAATQQAE